MLTHIFYLTAIIPFIFELYCIFNYKRFYSYIDYLINNIKNLGNINSNSSKEEKEKLKKFALPFTLLFLIQIVYYAWVIIGIFSSQYLFFIGIFIISIITNSYREKLKPYTLYVLIDSISCFSLITLIILNKYYFHINITKAIGKFIYNNF